MSSARTHRGAPAQEARRGERAEVTPDERGGRAHTQAAPLAQVAAAVVAVTSSGSPSGTLAGSTERNQSQDWPARGHVHLLRAARSPERFWCPQGTDNLPKGQPRRGPRSLVHSAPSAHSLLPCPPHPCALLPPATRPRAGSSLNSICPGATPLTPRLTLTPCTPSDVTVTGFYSILGTCHSLNVTCPGHGPYASCLPLSPAPRGALYTGGAPRCHRLWTQMCKGTSWV